MDVRRMILVCWLVCFMGCASIAVQPYIPDRHPYTQKFYKSFDEVSSTVIDALSESGWDISTSVDPAVYERNPAMESSGGKQTLLFTQVRKRGMVRKSEEQLNVYLRELSPSTIEVEVRYRKAGRLFGRTYGYRNDRIAKQLFAAIEEKFAQQHSVR